MRFALGKLPDKLRAAHQDKYLSPGGDEPCASEYAIGCKPDGEQAGQGQPGRGAHSRAEPEVKQEDDGQPIQGLP